MCKGRQAGRQLDENLCDLNFCDLTNPANSKASFSCLNRFMVLIARQKKIYGLYLKEMLL